MQRELGLTYLFISHNLSLVRHISTRIAVMYLGRIVEIAAADALLDRPAHPYTRALLSAVPITHPREQRHRHVLGGDVPSALAVPAGCRFAPRCPHAQGRCRTVDPAHDAGFAAFNIHSRIHALHPEAHCVLHTHMPYATAITMLAGGRLEPASQEALRFYDDIAYDDSYNGLAHDVGEGERIAHAMGGKHVIFLAHHGVIVVGPSVAQAFDHLYYLERAAELQVKAMSCNRPLRLVPHETAKKTVGQFNREREHWARLHLDALRRKLDREQPAYAD